MLWRSAEHVLVQRGETFLLLSPNGELAGRFAPRAFSDEDDLWRTVQVVAGDQLLERTTIEHGGYAVHLHEEKVLARGLVPVSDAATRELAERAFAALNVADSNERMARERAAAARVDAIAGAREELGAGPLVASAQTALQRRIATWGDERAASLLRTLISLAKAKVHQAVLAGFARGCLFACFEHSVPGLPPATQVTPHPEFARELTAHAAALEDDATGQEYADAPRNAAAFQSAAESIRWAAQLLSP